MFKVSTKGDYGLLLMTALAEKDRGNFVSLKKIAEEKNLSFSYISQIILPLKEAGLVESKEGVLGGYRLAKDPAQITLMDILEAIEGKITPVKCTTSEHTVRARTSGSRGSREVSSMKKKCQCEGVCCVKYAWYDAILLLRQFFKSRTLADIIRKKSSDDIILLSS